MLERWPCTTIEIIPRIKVDEKLHGFGTCLLLKMRSGVGRARATELDLARQQLCWKEEKEGLKAELHSQQQQAQCTILHLQPQLQQAKDTASQPQVQAQSLLG